MPTEPIIEETPPAFVPYEVAGIGTVEGHDGADYLVRVPSGALHGYRSPSGTPSEELAAEEIAYAIANPPAFPAPAAVLTPLTILSRMTPTEEAALNASGDIAVMIVKTRLSSASEIRSDDPRTDEGKAILIAKGILTAERAAEIFA